MKKKKPPKVRIGTAHFLRSGAGPHKDKKKEQKYRRFHRKDIRTLEE